MRDIGKNIKTLRIGQNMTQEELAERLFVTRQTVSNYETGRSRPDVEMLAKIAEVLNTDANTVIYGPSKKINKKQEYIKTAISVAIILLMILPVPWINDITGKLHGLQFIILPRYLFVVYYLPFLLLCIGWSAVQLLSLFTQLTPLPHRKTNRLFIGTLIFIAFYDLMMILVILPFTKPRWLLYTLYFMMGVWPDGCSINWGYLLLPAGSLLWLCGFPCKRAKKPSP